MGCAADESSGLCTATGRRKYNRRNPTNESMSSLGCTPEQDLAPCILPCPVAYGGPALHVGSRLLQLHNLHVHMQGRDDSPQAGQTYSGVCREDPQHVI
jgi:hypothetical protein